MELDVVDRSSLLGGVSFTPTLAWVTPSLGSMVPQMSLLIETVVAQIWQRRGHF